MKKYVPHNIFERGMGVFGLSILKFQILMEKCAPQNCYFSSVLWRLLVTMLSNFLTPFISWDIMSCESEPLPFLQSAKELLVINMIFNRNFFLFHPTSLSVCFVPCYWSHHLKNLLESSILSTPVKSFHIGLPS